MVNIPFWITRHGSACINSIGESRRKGKEVITTMKKYKAVSYVLLLLAIMMQWQIQDIKKKLELIKQSYNITGKKPKIFIFQCIQIA